MLAADCLEAARELLDTVPGDCRVAVLNMANAYRPGGGWLHGAGAQEENLHRRSNLSDHLSNYREAVLGHKLQYPLGEWGCVFSPDVCVFRGHESAGYPFLSAPFFVSVLTAAAYERPRLEGGQLGDEFAAGTAKKITHFPRAAKLNGADCLVLSAFGCGAFGNPPGHVAEIFRSILFADEFAGQFRLVRLAIIEDLNSPDGGNVAPFRRVFGDVGAA